MIVFGGDELTANVGETTDRHEVEVRVTLDEGAVGAQSVALQVPLEARSAVFADEDVVQTGVGPAHVPVEEHAVLGVVVDPELSDDGSSRAGFEAGDRGFVHPGVVAGAALAGAGAGDRLRGAGVVRSPIDGVPVSVKDLCDVGGHTTRAGSIALADVSPARRDATVLARLRAAGAVIVGTTNMVEFALGGLGLKPAHPGCHVSLQRPLGGGDQPAPVLAACRRRIRTQAEPFQVADALAFPHSRPVPGAGRAPGFCPPPGRSVTPVRAA